MTTNITHEHRRAFDAMLSGEYDNFGLVSCFVNGEPACAIVAVNRRGETYILSPLFVSITPGMVLTDHDGRPCAAEAGAS
jgi:hypothetical protein